MAREDLAAPALDEAFLVVEDFFVLAVTFDFVAPTLALGASRLR